MPIGRRRSIPDSIVINTRRAASPCLKCLNSDTDQIFLYFYAHPAYFFSLSFLLDSRGPHSPALASHSATYLPVFSSLCFFFLEHKYLARPRSSSPAYVSGLGNLPPRSCSGPRLAAVPKLLVDMNRSSRIPITRISSLQCRPDWIVDGDTIAQSTDAVALAGRDSTHC